MTYNPAEERNRWGGPSPWAGRDSRTDAQKRDDGPARKSTIYAVCQDAYEACPHESFHSTLDGAKQQAVRGFRAHKNVRWDQQVILWREERVADPMPALGAYSPPPPILRLQSLQLPGDQWIAPVHGPGTIEDTSWYIEELKLEA